MGLRLEPLTIDRMAEFRGLLGSADFGGCFCAVWTSHGEDWGKRCADSAQPNFALTHRDVERGRKAGFFVYQDNELIGWTGAGPKTEFPWLASKLASRLTPSTSDVWSIGCISLLEKFRGRNLSEEIVRAVAVRAKSQGAVSLEAYPARPFHEPRVFRGTYSLYKRLGFQEAGVEKDGDFDIVLMQLALRAAL